METYEGKPVFEASSRWILKDAVSRCGEKMEPPYVVRIPADTQEVRCNAFESDKTIDTVILPDSVKEIKYRTFSFSALRKIDIPDSVVKIDSYSFERCKNLELVNISESVREIETGAFSGCKSLRNLLIPGSVTSIGLAAFSPCSGLERIRVASNNPVYDSREDCNAVIETSTDTLIVGCQNTVIPNSVKVIGGFAFCRCSSLTSIHIPDSVKIIEDGAFDRCENLKEVYISNPSLLKDTLLNEDAQIITEKDGERSISTIGEWRSHAGADEELYEGKPVFVASSAKELAAAVSSRGDQVKPPYVVKIPSGSNQVRSYAFLDDKTVGVVILPDSIKLIGNEAFCCSKLTKVIIPDSVSEIGGEAFQFSDLRGIYIPKSLVKLGPEVFVGCKYLREIEVDGANSVYDSRENCNAVIETATNRLLYGCRSSVIPDSVVEIYDYAFYGCEYLRSITIPASVERIGKFAFCGCENLGGIRIPDSVKEIGSFAFSRCSSIERIRIPDAVEKIGKCAFSECDNLKEIYISNPGLLQGVVENQSVSIISGFKHTPKTKTALIAAIREEIKLQGHRADLNCIDTSAIKNMRELFNKFKTFDGDISEWNVSNVTDMSDMFNGSEFDGDISKWDVSNVKDMTDMFRSSRFRGDISGWNVDNVECFFPMFCYCRLVDDHKPARFRRNRPADAPVLEGKLNWMDVSFSLSGDGVCVVSGNLSEKQSSGSFWGCDLHELPVKHLVIAEGVTEIGDYSFYEWSQIEELTLPSSLVSIGDDAFGRCRNIQRIHFSEGLQEIGSSAFGACPVDKLDLPKTLTKIGGYAFSGFDRLVELDLPDSIVSIGNRAFRKCSSLRLVKLPAHLKVISESLFDECTALEQVKMPEDLEEIDSYAFADCPNLKSMTLPDSVRKFGYKAFESEEFDEGGLHYCISNYITNINGCTVSADDWDGELDISSSISHEGRTFVVDNFVFSNCKRLTSVRIPDTFSEIPDGAFAGCKALRSIEIPSSVTTIGVEAFRCCEALKSIELPDAVTEIAERLFKGCWRLRKVRFGPNVTKIGSSAFEGCEFLQHLPLPDSVRRIGTSAFEDCKNLVDLGQPSSLEFVGLYALANTAMLLMQDGPIYIGNALCGYRGSVPDHACLEVRDGTTTVAEAALRGHKHLESVIFPESLKFIGYEAFNECRNLKHVHLPKSLEFIEDGAFDWSAVAEVEVPWKSPIKIGCRPFPERTQVCVPVGSLAAYKAAAYWKDYQLLEKENCASDPSRFITDDTVVVGRKTRYRVVLVEKPAHKSPWNLYGAIVPAKSDVDDRKIVKDLLFEAFRDTARYLDLTDWSGDSYSPAKEMDYASQRFAVVDLPEDAEPQTRTFEGRNYLTDEAFYNSLISGGVQWEPLEKD